jgi:cytochrome c
MLAALFGFSLAPVAFAEEDPALVAKGKELFDNTKGSLDVKMNCIICHKGTKAVDPAKVAEVGDNLPDVINKYLVNKAKGTALANDSEEMKALVAYLRSGQK